MLTHPDGNMMVKKAIEGIPIEAKDTILTILKEHEEQYDIIAGLKDNLGDEITIVVLDKQTESQSETIYQTLKKANVTESFLVKDSDNLFSIEKPNEDFNYVCFSDIHEHEEINPGNKSYIKLNEQGIIVDIVEKQVVSKFFNVGGYYFKSPSVFMKTYEKLSSDTNNKELFLSHVIQDMIANSGEVFLGKEAKNYFDWGTLNDWFKYRKKFKTFIFDIDGIVFENAGQHFKPRWGDKGPIKDNIELIKKLSDDPYTQLYFLTSRPEKFRQLTENMLNENGIKHSGLIMGCNHAKRIIVNDFSNTTGYPTCEAINILRNSEDLKKYI
jgi:hypothetical protein